MKYNNPPQDHAGLRRRLDAAIDRALHERRIVGAVVLVAAGGETAYRRAAGLADREAHRPMAENGIFRLASMTKPLVSTAALALVDRGALRLTDPVTKWLPDFRPRLPDGRAPAITIHQLLTHTAGLNYAFMEPADGPYHRAHVSDGLDQPGLSMQENLRRIAAAGLLYPPGTRWGYSVAIDVLGEIVARASGGTLPQAVARFVTTPLGMKDTAFTVHDRSRLVTPYTDGRPEPVRMADPQTVRFDPGAGIVYSPSRALNPKSFPSGGAGMVGTAGDFLTFLEALRTGRPRLVQPATLARMRQVQTGKLDVNGSNGGWGFGYGFSVLKDQALAKTPQSNGTLQWGGAYGHSWFVDLSRGLSVVAMTNTAVEGMSGEFPIWVRDAVYGVAPS